MKGLGRPSNSQNTKGDRGTPNFPSYGRKANVNINFNGRNVRFVNHGSIEGNNQYNTYKQQFESNKNVKGNRSNNVMALRSCSGEGIYDQGRRGLMKVFRIYSFSWFCTSTTPLAQPKDMHIYNPI